jgi:hypothetical protein
MAKNLKENDALGVINLLGNVISDIVIRANYFRGIDPYPF